MEDSLFMLDHIANEHLGATVRDLRNAGGWSLRGLAAAADVDATWLMRLERGEYRSPDALLLRQLAEALDVPASDLLTAAGFEDGAELPQLPTYLRTKYELPDEAIQQLDAHFRLLDEKYRRERRGGAA